MKNPSLIQTHFLSAEDVAYIVNKQGLAACLRGVADAIRVDFLRCVRAAPKLVRI